MISLKCNCFGGGGGGPQESGHDERQPLNTVAGNPNRLGT